MPVKKENSTKKKKVLKELVGYLITIIVAVIVATLIRIFIFEPFIVPTPSMEPTLKVNDKVIINKLSFKFDSIERGDIVAFYSPIEESKNLVKRAVGIEGDEISLTSEGEIFVNGEKIVEDYLPADMNASYLNQIFVVKEDEVFVMGDNRNNSYDSRFFGSISEDNIFGKLLIIYWPPSRW